MILLSLWVTLVCWIVLGRAVSNISTHFPLELEHNLERVEMLCFQQNSEVTEQSCLIYFKPCLLRKVA